MYSSDIISEEIKVLRSENIIKHLYVLMLSATLSGSKKQSYESLYNLFVYICKHDLYLLRNHPEIYRASGKKRDEIYLDLLNLDPEKKEKPLWRILDKMQQQYVNNYIQIIGSIPGNIPLEIKRNIASFI